MSEPPRGSDAIGPTAHYTGAVWAENGLSTPELRTTAGRVLLASSRPALAISHLLGGPTLEEFLLARHRLIDHLLVAAIERGDVSQVLEIACGMSPRGWRFARRFGEGITYVEADLPAMAERKREALARSGSLSEHHRVVEFDALATHGLLSMDAIAATLDPGQGLAVISEGLLVYLDRSSVERLWRRTAVALSKFSSGIYLADIHLSEENGGALAPMFLRGLSLFVRARVELHFADLSEAQGALRAAGFADAQLHRPLDFTDQIDVGGPGAGLVRVLEARP